MTAHSTADVSATLRVANEHRHRRHRRRAVAPVSSVEPRPHTGAIALDLTGLNHIVDPTSVQPRYASKPVSSVPSSRRFLNPRGFTVGHFPQSFDLATVGGWIACRGAGQYSNRYGKIEDIVRGLTVVLASGEVIAPWRTRPATSGRSGSHATLRRLRGHPRRDHRSDVARAHARAVLNERAALLVHLVRRWPRRLPTYPSARRASRRPAPLRRDESKRQLRRGGMRADRAGRG